MDILFTEECLHPRTLRIATNVGISLLVSNELSSSENQTTLLTFCCQTRVWNFLRAGARSSHCRKCGVKSFQEGEPFEARNYLQLDYLLTHWLTKLNGPFQGQLQVVQLLSLLSTIDVKSYAALTLYQRRESISIFNHRAAQLA
jgi:hypothetical protein